MCGKLQFDSNWRVDGGYTNQIMSQWGYTTQLVTRRGLDLSINIIGIILAWYSNIKKNYSPWNCLIITWHVCKNLQLPWSFSFLKANWYQQICKYVIIIALALFPAAWYFVWKPSFFFNQTQNSHAIIKCSWNWKKTRLKQCWWN